MNVDEQLLKNIRKGKVSAFETFFQNSYARLLNYAKLFIPNDDAADDMVQEAFIHFWNKRKELKTGNSIEALMFTSVRNRCLNYLRDENTYKAHLNIFKAENKTVQRLYQYDFLGDEEETLEEILIKELNVAIGNLPEKCRQVYLMNKVYGKKQEKIAEELGISIKSVEKHISSAKSKLHKNLKLKFPTLSIFITFFI